MNAIDPLNAMEKTLNEVHKCLVQFYYCDIDWNNWIEDRKRKKRKKNQIPVQYSEPNN